MTTTPIETHAGSPPQPVGPWPFVLVRQRQTSDCGVACLAMAAQVDYEEAKNAFDACGLGVRRGAKRPYSSTFRDLIAAARVLRLEPRMKRFKGWSSIYGRCIVKVSNGHRTNWHWVFASRTQETGLVVLDPMSDAICAEHAPVGFEAMTVPHHLATGCLIEIDQTTICETKGAPINVG